MIKRQYPEAFALIIYDGPEGQSETVWNSRDGIAPWEIPTRDGNATMNARDEFAGIDPDYVPRPGERVIVNADAEKMRDEEIGRVTREWNYYAPSYREMHGIDNLDDAIDHIRKKNYLGAPCLITLDESGWCGTGK